MAALDLNAIESRGLGASVPSTPGDIINATLPYVFAFAGISLLVFLMLGGLQMMTAKGDPKAIEGAQAKITSALIGFVIIIISYVLVKVVTSLLGLGTLGGVFR